MARFAVFTASLFLTLAANAQLNYEYTNYEVDATVKSFTVYEKTLPPGTDLENPEQLATGPLDKIHSYTFGDNGMLMTDTIFQDHNYWASFYSYDSLMRLTTLEYYRNEHLIARSGFQYDTIGQITREVQVQFNDAGEMTSDKYWTYAYTDTLLQNMSCFNNGNDSSLYNVTHYYAFCHGQLIDSVSDPNQDDYVFAYDPVTRLLVEKRSYTYDTEYIFNQTNFKYDKQNRLIEEENKTFHFNGTTGFKTTYEYTEAGYIRREYKHYTTKKMMLKEVFHYNLDSQLIKEERMNEKGRKAETTTTYDYRFDLEGNWTVCITAINGEPAKMKFRHLVYY